MALAGGRAGRQRALFRWRMKVSVGESPSDAEHRRSVALANREKMKAEEEGDRKLSLLCIWLSLPNVLCRLTQQIGQNRELLCGAMKTPWKSFLRRALHSGNSCLGCEAARVNRIKIFLFLQICATLMCIFALQVLNEVGFGAPVRCYVEERACNCC